MNIKTILGYAIGPVGLGLIGFVSLPLVTWFYSAEDVGRISMLQIFTNLFVLLFCIGLDQSYVREYHEEKNKAALLKTVIIPGFILGIIFLILLLSFFPRLISNFLYDISSWYLSLLTAFCFILALLIRFLSLILRMKERSIAYSVSQLLPKIIFLLLVLLSVILVGSNNIKYLLQIHLFSIMVSVLVLVFNTRKECGLAIIETINYNNLKKYLHFGFPLIFGGLASWGLNVMDRMFLKQYSYTELGVYSVAVSLVGVVTVFSGIFNTIWMPLVYKWLKDGKANEEKIEKISKLLLFFMAVIVLLSGLLSWIITLILPSGYEKIQYLIPICLIGPLFYTLSETTSVGITIVRKTKYSMLASLIAMLVSMCMNFFLVKAYGANGAAISTATAFFIFFVLRTEFSKICWKKSNTTEHYVVTITLLIFSILFTLRIFEFWVVIVLIFILGTLLCYYYRVTVKETFLYLKIYKS